MNEVRLIKLDEICRIEKSLIKITSIVHIIVLVRTNDLLKDPMSVNEENNLITVQDEI